MVSRRTRIVVRSRRTRGINALGQIFNTIRASSRRTIGLLLLVFTALLTLNYNSNETDNWITKAADKIIMNDVWGWLGSFIKSHILQVLHCFWLTTVSFLATNPELAIIVSLIMSVLTLSMTAATNMDITLQCLFVYLLLSLRNSVMRILVLIALVTAVIMGHAFKNYGQ